MKKTTNTSALSIFIFLLSFSFLNAQNVGNPPNWNWIQSIGGSSLDYGTDVVADASGNTYVAGIFNGTIKMGNNQWQSIGQQNGFLAKFAPDGTLIWAEQFKSNSNDGEVFGQSVSLDNAGNVVVTGHFKYGPLVVGNMEIPLTGNTDIFVAKFSAGGSATWLKSYGQLGATYLSNKLAIDASGDIYCLSNSAIIKFSAAGNFLWKKNKPGGSQGGDLVWSNGKIFLGGSFFKNIDINGTMLNADFEAIFMCEVDPSFGDLSNPVKLFESGYSFGSYLVLKSLIVKNMDEIYAAGQLLDSLYSGSCAVGGNYPGKGFIGKTGVSGCHWLLSEYTSQSTNIVNKIVLDGNGNLYGGGDRNTATIALGGFDLPAGSKGFQVKINAATGGVLALKDSPAINGLATDASNNVYATGLKDLGAYLGKSNNLGSSVFDTTFENDGGNCLFSSLESDGTGMYLMATVFGKVKLANLILDVPKSSMLVAKLSLDGNQVLWHTLVEGVLGVYRTEGGIVSYLDKTFGKFYCSGSTLFPFSYNGQTYPNPNNPDRGYFVVQTGTDGSSGWLKLLPGVNYLANITTDNAGNVIVCGTFANTATFDNITLTEKGYNDFFIAKFDKNGTVLWAKRGGGDDIEYAAMASTDAQNNIYFAAEGLSLQLDINDVWSLSSQDGDGNILLGKLTPDGEVSWVNLYGKSIDYEGACYPFAIKTDPVGNTYMYGLLGKLNEFGNITLSSPYNLNNFVAKFDPNGDPLWASPIKTKRLVNDPGEIDIDELGDLYITGQIRDSTFIENNVLTLQGNPLARNFYIARFDGGNGSVDWVKTMSGSPESIGLPTAMSVHDHNSILCGGTFQDRVAFDNVDLNSYSSNGGYIGLLGSSIMVAVHTPVVGKTRIEISPNPAGSFTNLSSIEDMNSPVQVSIANNQGGVVFQQNFKGLTEARNIDVSQLSPGVYFLNVVFEGTMETKRLVVTR